MVQWGNVGYMGARERVWLVGEAMAGREEEGSRRVWHSCSGVSSVPTRCREIPRSGKPDTPKIASETNEERQSHPKGRHESHG